jgi:hypothetical protein
LAEVEKLEEVEDQRHNQPENEMADQPADERHHAPVVGHPQTWRLDLAAPYAEAHYRDHSLMIYLAFFHLACLLITLNR